MGVDSHGSSFISRNGGPNISQSARWAGDLVEHWSTG